MVQDVDVETDEGEVGAGDGCWLVDHDVVEGGENGIQNMSGGVGGIGYVLGEYEVSKAFEKGD